MTSPVAPPTMTDAPVAPDRSDRATFSPRATAWADFQKTTLVPEVRAAIGNAFANATSAHESAEVAKSARVSAEDAATQAAQFAGATAWVAGDYTAGTVVYSPSSGLVYRRKAPGGASPTDPTADPARWRLAVLAAPLYRPEAAATSAAEVGVHHGLRYAGAQELVMPTPASLVDGDVLWVTVENGRADNFLSLSGAKVNGEAPSGGVLVLDDPFAAILCRWTGATYGWSI